MRKQLPYISREVILIFASDVAGACEKFTCETLNINYPVLCSPFTANTVPDKTPEEAPEPFTKYEKGTTWQTYNDARMLLTYALRRRLHPEYSQLARSLGLVSHSSVIYRCRRCQDLLDIRDPFISRWFQEMTV